MSKIFNSIIFSAFRSKQTSAILNRISTQFQRWKHRGESHIWRLAGLCPVGRQWSRHLAATALRELGGCGKRLHDQHGHRFGLSWDALAQVKRKLNKQMHAFSGRFTYVLIGFSFVLCTCRSRAPIQSKSHIHALAASRSGASRGGIRAARTPTILPTSRRSHLI